MIPVHFARISIAIGKPSYVARVLGAAGIEALQREMEEELKSLYAKALAGL